jgi:F0F1-type ATP synthase assembly protein I
LDFFGEFTVALPTILCGLICVVIGVVGYLNQDPTGKVSWTALIPAILGGVIILCGLLSLKDSLRKHVMHLAALLGLIGFAGGFMPLVRQAGELRKAAEADGQTMTFREAWGKVDWLKSSAVSGWSMSVVSFLFVALCIRSFIVARKAREEKAQEAALGRSVAPHPANQAES